MNDRLASVKARERPPEAGVSGPQTSKPALHFVGFRDERYWNAVRIWGKPDFIHITYDRYAAHDMLACDTVVFAKGDWTQAPRSFGGPDVFEADASPDE